MQRVWRVSLFLLVSVSVVVGVVILPAVASSGTDPSTYCKVYLTTHDINPGQTLPVRVIVFNGHPYAVYSGPVVVIRITAGNAGSATYSFSTNARGVGTQVKTYPTQFGPRASTSNPGIYKIVAEISSSYYTPVSCIAYFKVN